jgi:hypothetical protein
MGEAFQMTPWGVVSGLAPVVTEENPEELIASRADIVQTSNERTQRHQFVEPQPQRVIVAAPIPATPKPTPKDIVKLAAARVREIKAELRNHAKLQTELAELERLIAAAKAKPLATIRKIETARHAGVEKQK